MKYVYYGLAVFAFLQALGMAALFGVIIEDSTVSQIISFIYGGVSGYIAGNLLVLGWEEK